MEYIAGLILVYIVFMGAMVSPGPDFLMTVRNALGFSARAGVFTAAGIAMGCLVHMTYSIAGLGLLISQSVLAYNVVKWIGAGYLIYMGWHALRSKGMNPEDMKRDHLTDGTTGRIKSDGKAFMNGLWANLLNPKATLFFVALFSQMISPDIPVALLAVFCLFCGLTIFAWFSGVSFVMAIPAIRRGYARSSKWIDRTFGAFFVALGMKLALSKAH